MAALAGVGLVSYNGLVFDGPMISSKVTMESVRGEDDRAVMYTNITIDIHATISIDGLFGSLDYCGEKQSTIDATPAAAADYLSGIDKIRAMLSQDGKPLVFNDKIFHLFEVNTGTGTIDVNYGPRCRLSSITPIVSNRAFEVVWSVTAAVGTCPQFEDDGAPSGTVGREWADADIRQCVYTVAWSADHRGYSSRTVAGFIEIINVNAGVDETLTFTADDFREKLTISLPDGFRRSGNEWTLNERRDRINFHIRDDEIASQNSFPPDVVDIAVSHKVSIGQSSGYQQAVNELSGYCEVANPHDSSLAWERLFPIISGRISSIRSSVGAIILLDVSVTEELFSRTVHFSISYQALTTSPSGFLQACGIFTKTTDTWADYRASMYGPSEDEAEPGLPFSPRSIANLSYEPTDDVLITPCSPQPITISIHNQRSTPFPAKLQSVLQNVCPPKEKSYRDYKSTLTVAVKGGAALFVEMPVASTSFVPAGAATSDGTELTSGVNSDVSNVRAIDSSASGQMVEFILEGNAQRLGYPVELPQLTQKWGEKVKKIPNGSWSKTANKMFLGCRMYFMQWSIRYKIAQSLVDAASDLGDLKTQIFVTPSYPAGDQADAS